MELESFRWQIEPGLAQFKRNQMQSLPPPFPAPADSEGVILEVFGCTDVGRSREHNEDAFLIFAPRHGALSDLEDVVTMQAPPEAGGVLFMVADGMGGAAAGEIASAMAVETVAEVLAQRWSDGNESLDQSGFTHSLRQATIEANSRIHRFAAENSEHRGMGTTATIAALLGDTLYLSQVGDSRAYLTRAGTVHQLTRDQSLMQRLVDAGELTPEEAAQSERRNIILQALGPEPSIRSDISFQRLRHGDILILCSDGLSGQVDVTDMSRIVAAAANVKEICVNLIALANERGGPDNITVIAARFSGSALDIADGDEQVGYTSFATESGESWRFTPPDSDGVLMREPSWFDGPAATPTPPHGHPKLPQTPAPSVKQAPEEHEFSRAVLYGILAAVAAGVALIVYARFF